MVDSRWIGRCAQQALLYEVSATPKPGLVDRNGSGVHEDMDFYTFLDSAVVLGPYFHRCAALGFGGDLADESLLLAIRPLGIKAESDMLLATGGVNTHKGLIYALGLLSAAAGACLPYGGDLPTPWIATVCQKVQSIVVPHMERELQVLQSTKTYGAQQYQHYGLLGARGEALSGYEKAREIGLKALEKGLTVFGLSMNDAMLYALVSLIVVIEDSNVIGRKGREILAQSQNKAQAILDAGHLMSEDGRRLYAGYVDWSLKAGVSHGGAADMLSVSVFLWLLKSRITQPLNDINR